MRGVAIALVLSAASRAQAGGFLDQGLRGPFVGTNSFLPLSGGTLSGGLTLTDGNLVLGLNQELRLDDDGTSFIECTANDSCNLSANNTTILTWSGTTIGLSANTTAGVVALNFASASTFRIAANEAAVPAEPTACASGTFGTMRAVNDTNDGAHSQVCYCGQIANDATYDWLIVGTTTACPFF